MERQSKGSRDLKAYYKRGQGPLWAIAPPEKKWTFFTNTFKKVSFKKVKLMEKNLKPNRNRKTLKQISWQHLKDTLAKHDLPRSVVRFYSTTNTFCVLVRQCLMNRRS
jgi:hypothetical protein